MGCICSKGIPPEEEGDVNLEKSIKSSAVAPSKREDIVIVGADVAAGTYGATTQDNGVASPLTSDDVKKKAPQPVVIDAQLSRRVSSHQRRATVDAGSGQTEQNIRIAHVPNSFEAEHVAAGWPNWLASVAGEAIKGWVPRKSESFEKLDKIGQGTYSSVYRARDLETGKIVALKKVRFVNMDPESVRFMAREIHVLRRLDHPNVVKLEGLITSRMSGSLYLVFEYMEHDLAGLVATPGIKFTEPQVKCYMQQLLRGLDHCHSRGVLHRDIKGSNLLLDNNGNLRIADFGLATFFSPDQKQPLTSRVVTLWYRAPELLLGATEYGVSVDLWSAGCILAELLAGKPIMPGRTEVEQMHKIFKLCGSPPEEYWRNSKLPHATIFKPQHPYKRHIREVFKEFPSSALDLMDALLAIKPEDRGTAASALNSGFFTTKPLPCDPSTLPQYSPSKEYDAKLRDEEARRQREVAKGRGSESVRNGPRESRRMPGQAVIAQFEASLQKKQDQSNPKNAGRKYNPLDDGESGFPINHHKGAGHNGLSHSSSMMHPRALGSSWTNKVREDEHRFGRQSSTIKGPESKTQKSNMTKSGGRQSDIHGVESKQSQQRYNQLDVVEASDEWSHHMLDRPSSSHKQVERIGANNPTSGYGTKKSRIHYSGPLMPPGGNLEEMLKEHERQIQQAVRKARIDKAKTKNFEE